MAVFEPSRVAPIGAISNFGLADIAENVVHAVRAKLVAARTYRQLSRLSAAQLNDIGLGDRDLASFCEEAARVRR